ncbi:MAG TPA: BON domain-containing protein [Bryobacteraceae bacterium]|jgi:hyperosmotically inducible protein|nr:BON domain-containing protein [Bryobacteraceae bacterium]
MKPLALSIALACALVGCRTNETPRAQMDDLEITANVKSKLASNIGLSTVPDVSVNATNGVVTLSGSVDSAQTKSRIDAIAKGIPKVTGVVDNLQVAPRPHSGGD